MQSDQRALSSLKELRWQKDRDLVREFQLRDGVEACRLENK
jgi:hypothetical protein